MPLVNAELTIRVPDKAGILAAVESVVDIKVNVDVNRSLLGPGSTKPAKWHPEEDWDRIRSAFTASYLQENKTIYDAKDEMAAKFKFHASVKQYKYRVQKWNLSKNLPANSKENLGQVAEKCYRDKIPLPACRSDGSFYPWHKVRRQDLANGRRKDVWKGLALPKIHQEQHFTISNTNWSLPKSSSIHVCPDIMSSERQFGRSPPLQRIIDTPDQYRLNEYLFDRVVSFIPVSATKLGIQDPIGSSTFFHVVRRIYTSLLDETRDTSVASALFREAHHELQLAMRHPSAIFLMELFHISGWRHWSKTTRLSAAMTELIKISIRLARAFLGDLHPFTSIVSIYGNSEICHSRAWDCIFSELRRAHNLPDHALPFAVHQVAHFQFQAKAFDDGACTVETFKKLTASMFGEHSHWPRRLSLLLALECHENRSQWTKAKEAFEYATGGDPRDLDEVKVRGLRGLLKLYTNPKALPDTNKSIELAYKVFEASSSCHGPFDDATLWDLKDLRTILQINDRQEELCRLDQLRAIQYEASMSQVTSNR